MTCAVSILLSSRDRAGDLNQTLRALRGMIVPDGWDAELLLVDNGSTDDTLTVMRAFEAASPFFVRVLREPRPGKARALNRALDVARGEVLLFTDDDVRVPTHWIREMSAPIVEGRADAVAGAVRLDSSLRRTWMNGYQAGLLAETTNVFDEDPPSRLVGANMALHRRIFDAVQGFDPELGPGALGLEEDTLLGLQVQFLHFRLVGAPATAIEHQLDPRRLHRRAFLSSLERLGRSQAYVDYHWRHAEASRLRSGIAYGYWGTRLAGWRCLNRTPAIDDEGIAPEEMGPVYARAYHRQMMRLVGAPRKYERFGGPRTRRRENVSTPKGTPQSALPIGETA